MGISRRSLLAAGSATLGLGAFPPLLSRVLRRSNSAAPPLQQDPAGLLDLPAGFSYRVLDRAMSTMSDNFRVPASPDGMGCFQGPKGTIILMRNHELDIDPSQAAYADAPPESFDRGTFGAVTRLVLSQDVELISSNLVLAGTLRNCGGGTSPWGWFSAEESVEPGHGYVFLCSPDADTVRDPRPIAAYGRFNHEAVCIDPKTNVAYMTEDQEDGCLYSFVPHDPAKPFEGRLRALRVKGAPRLDTGRDLKESVAIDWVDVPSPDTERDTVRYQAQELGAALVRRGEGIAFHAGCVYVCATLGGTAGFGQILRVRDDKNPTISVVAQSPDNETLEMPDNITVSASGLLVMAEDGLDGHQFIRGMTQTGVVYDIARNAHSGGELSGVCFSPDGNTLFLNMQRDGLTVAIRGPFAQLGQAADRG